MAQFGRRELRHGAQPEVTGEALTGEICVDCDYDALFLLFIYWSIDLCCLYYLFILCDYSYLFIYLVIHLFMHLLLYLCIYACITIIVIIIITIICQQ